MAGPQLSDVPDRYDVVFQLNNGATYGFLLADSVESNLPFRTHKALYSYSPTFLERQNVSAQYGDNFQDFFLTGAQDDFSLGENQKYFRVADTDRSRRYWGGKNIDPTTVPGNVTLTRTASLTSLTTAPQAITAASKPQAHDWWYLGTNTVYSLDGTTSASAAGHGLTSTAAFSVVPDYNNLYMGGDVTSTGSVRELIPPSTVSSFSASGAASLAYLNNILFGLQQAQNSTVQLLSYDATGNATVQFQWKNADGSGTAMGVGAGAYGNLIPYGGSLYVVLPGSTSELWKYDGSGVSLLTNLPEDFVTVGAAVAYGIVFISGYRYVGSSVTFKPVVYFYVNGSLGTLWECPTTTTNTPANNSITPYATGVIFQDSSTGNILQYDVGLGGVHTIATLPNQVALTSSNNTSRWVATTASSTNAYVYPGASYNSTGYIQTSQYDFDNSLNKLIRAIKVDVDIPANTSVDIAYQLDGCGGTYTTLATGVTSGTEYTLPANTTAHSISLQITLNSSTGSATPTLKRVYVRAAPLLQQFRRREYLLDLSGGVRENLGESARRNRDNTIYPYDPMTAANNLTTVALQTIPFTVVDKFSTNPGFTCLCDLEQNQEGYDGFAIYEIRPDVYIGRINVREV